MSKERIAKKNRDIVKALKNGEASTYVEPSGKRIIKKSAPNISEKKQVKRSIVGTRIVYKCPKCGNMLFFKHKMHQNLCMQCGQRLDWGDYNNMACVWIEVQSAEEAGYWAGQYESINGTLYSLEFDKWRLSVTRDIYPMLLFFPFPVGKEYGRFMRKATKEAKIIKEVNHYESTI